MDDDEAAASEEKSRRRAEEAIEKLAELIYKAPPDIQALMVRFPPKSIVAAVECCALPLGLGAVVEAYGFLPTSDLDPSVGHFRLVLRRLLPNGDTADETIFVAPWAVTLISLAFSPQWVAHVARGGAPLALPINAEQVDRAVKDVFVLSLVDGKPFEVTYSELEMSATGSLRVGNVPVVLINHFYDSVEEE